MRNIDYIRTLKPKKLVKFMAYQICDGCDCCVNHNPDEPCGDETKDEDCASGTKKWLKQRYNEKDRVWRDIFE